MTALPKSRISGSKDLWVITITTKSICKDATLYANPLLVIQGLSAKGAANMLDMIVLALQFRSISDGGRIMASGLLSVLLIALKNLLR